MSNDIPWRIPNLPNWEETPIDNVLSFKRKNSGDNSLQVSLNWNSSGRKFNPVLKPMELATKLATDRGAKVSTGNEGTCEMGRYGRVLFTAENVAYGEAWIVTDELHVLLATFISEKTPDPKAIEEVSEFVRAIRWPTQ